MTLAEHTLSRLAAFPRDAESLAPDSELGRLIAGIAAERANATRQAADRSQLTSRRATVAGLIRAAHPGSDFAHMAALMAERIVLDRCIEDLAATVTAEPGRRQLDGQTRVNLAWANVSSLRAEISDAVRKRGDLERWLATEGEALFVRLAELVGEPAAEEGIAA